MNDNRLKSLNGTRCKTSLIEILKDIQKAGAIVCCSENFRCGYPKKSNDQFYAPFTIEFRSGDVWLIFSTNSIRNDRLCIQQWNAENIKRINPNVKRALVVVPDEIEANEREAKEVSRYKNKILGNEYYSAIDDVIYQHQLLAECGVIK